MLILASLEHDSFVLLLPKKENNSNVMEPFYWRCGLNYFSKLNLSLPIVPLPSMVFRANVHAALFPAMFTNLKLSNIFGAKEKIMVVM